MKKYYLLFTLLLIIILGLVYFGRFTVKKAPKILSNNDLHTQIKSNILTQNLPYPLPSLQLLLFKKEQKMELWTTTDTSKNFIKTYKIQLENAEAGTRLYNSETIFPEGEYKLNWNSNKELELSFPNEYDTLKASADKRSKPIASLVFSTLKQPNNVTFSSNDMNEIQLYVKDVNIEGVTLYSFPSDNRNGLPFAGCNHCPHWVMELYLQLDLILANFNK